jgi:carbamoylphosphate synthase small subunit
VAKGSFLLIWMMVHSTHLLINGVLAMPSNSQQVTSKNLISTATEYTQLSMAIARLQQYGPLPSPPHVRRNFCKTQRIPAYQIVHLRRIIHVIRSQGVPMVRIESRTVMDLMVVHINMQAQR